MSERPAIRTEKKTRKNGRGSRWGRTATVGEKGVKSTRGKRLHSPSLGKNPNRAVGGNEKGIGKGVQLPSAAAQGPTCSLETAQGREKQNKILAREGRCEPAMNYPESVGAGEKGQLKEKTRCGEKVLTGGGGKGLEPLSRLEAKVGGA